MPWRRVERHHDPESWREDGSCVEHHVDVVSNEREEGVDQLLLLEGNKDEGEDRIAEKVDKHSPYQALCVEPRAVDDP